jgi:hypothetical protein
MNLLALLAAFSFSLYRWDRWLGIAGLACFGVGLACWYGWMGNARLIRGIYHA